MRNQNKKMLMWVLGLGVFMPVIVILELLITKAIYSEEPETFKSCLSTMIAITMLVYVLVIVIKFVRYQKTAQEHERSIVEKTKKELTSEFKKVFMNCSGDISKDKFECKAKVDENGKIICEIFLDMKTTFESYEEFLEYFHLNENK